MRQHIKKSRRSEGTAPPPGVEVKSLLIGLGCSFTKGEGCCPLGDPDVERARAYPKKISDQLGWDSINYAEIGQGSRNQCLRLLTTDVSSYERVVVIYQQTGGGRFDWNTVHKGEIHATTRRAESDSWDDFYTEHRDFTEQFHNLLQVKTWCKMNNAQLIVWSAYDPQTTRRQLTNYLDKHWPNYRELIDLDDWWLIDNDDDLMLYDYFENNLGDEYKWYVNHNTKWLDRKNKILNNFHPSELGHQWIADHIIELIR